jgi:hypothetical protein
LSVALLARVMHGLVMRHALRLAGGAALAPGELLAQALVVAQAYAGGNRVGQWQPATGNVARIRGPPGMVAPTLVRAAVARTRRRIRLVPQSRRHQHSNASQADQVHPGDHQQQLSLA